MNFDKFEKLEAERTEGAHNYVISGASKPEVEAFVNSLNDPDIIYVTGGRNFEPMVLVKPGAEEKFENALAIGKMTEEIRRAREEDGLTIKGGPFVIKPELTEVVGPEALAPALTAVSVATLQAQGAGILSQPAGAEPVTDGPQGLREEGFRPIEATVKGNSGTDKLSTSNLSEMSAQEQQTALAALINGGAAKINISGIGEIETSEGRLSVGDVKENKDLMNAIANDIRKNNPELAGKFDQLAQGTSDVAIQDNLNSLSGRLSDRGRANAGIEAALEDKNLQPENVVNAMLKNAGINANVKDAQLLGEGGAYDGMIKMEVQGLTQAQAEALAAKSNGAVVVLNEGMNTVIKINEDKLTAEIDKASSSPSQPQQAFGDPDVTKNDITLTGFKGGTYKRGRGEPIDSIDFALDSKNLSALTVAGKEILDNNKFDEKTLAAADLNHDGTVNAREAGITAAAIGAVTKPTLNGTTIDIGSTVTTAEMNGFLNNPDQRDKVLKIAQAMAKDNGIVFSGDVRDGTAVSPQTGGGKAQPKGIDGPA